MTQTVERKKDRRGRKPYPPGKVKGIMFRVRLTPGLRRELDELAEERGTTASELIRQWIRRAWRRR